LAKTMDKDADVWAPFESALSRKQWLSVSIVSIVCSNCDKWNMKLWTKLND
jgi:hypothetical protein